MTEAEHVSVAGVRAYCRRAGRGEPVLLLHGLGASSYSWRHLLPDLARGFEVFAPDWPGFGRSEQPRDFDYSLAGFSRWLVAFMDRFGIAKGRLVGNSLGGLVSLFTALDHPDRVDRMALIGTPTYLESRPRILWPLRWPVIGSLYERSIGPWAVGLVARGAFADWSKITPDVIEEYSIAVRGPAGRRAVAQFIRNAVPPDAESYLRRYKDIRHSTLVIVGEKDAVVGPADARRFAAEVPGAEYLCILGSGHAPQEETPEPVVEALRSFLG